MADRWITVRHSQTGGTTQIRDLPRIVAAYQRRGWQPQTEQAEPTPTPPAEPVTGDDEVASTEQQSARRRRSE